MSELSQAKGSQDPNEVVTSWATRTGDVVVSTRYRESSALVNNPPWYFETFAFRDGQIIWQSSAVTEDKAQHQHDVAVRWFARLGS